MLQRGQAVPHFEITTLEGVTVRYASLWQRTNLVLVILPLASDPDTHYVRGLRAQGAEFLARNAACVVTTDTLNGLPTPAALVADRWGEIAHVWAGRDVSELPSPEELLDWVDHLELRCPECEGEAR